MLSFREFINTINEEKSEQPADSSWEDLIKSHRVQFGNKFDQKSIAKDDQQFLIALFEHYKYLSQQKSLNIFQTKLSGVIVQFGYFGNQLWACCIETEKTRELTERFKITDIKIQPMIDIFDKAIRNQTFKNLLPVVVK